MEEMYFSLILYILLQYKIFNEKISHNKRFRVRNFLIVFFNEKYS